jgi:hypothetical protein
MEFSVYQNELEVVFSLMSDGELMILKDKLEEMVKGEVYKSEGFPISCGGLRFLQASIMFSFWVRKGKGVKMEEGKIVMCELKESPFWQRYQPKEVVYEPDSPEHERDHKEEEEGEFV